MVAGRETDSTFEYSHSDCPHHCHYKSLRLDGQHGTMGHKCPLDDQMYSTLKQRNCYHYPGLSLLHSCSGIHWPSHWPLVTGVHWLVHWPVHWTILPCTSGLHWPLHCTGHYTALATTLLWPLHCTGHYTALASTLQTVLLAPAGDLPALQSRPDWPLLR